MPLSHHESLHRQDDEDDEDDTDTEPEILDLVSDDEPDESGPWGFHGEVPQFIYPPQWLPEKTMLVQLVVGCIPDEVLSKCYFDTVLYVGRIVDILECQGPAIPGLLPLSFCFHASF